MRTDDLRKLIKRTLDGLKIKGVTEVYSKTAADNAGFPHIVFDLESITTLSDDLHRFDYRLTVDVWDKNKSESLALELCDSIEDLLNSANLPQTSILPTFYLTGRRSVLDDNKDIKHQIIRFDVQLYEA